MGRITVLYTSLFVLLFFMFSVRFTPVEVKSLNDLPTRTLRPRVFAETIINPLQGQYANYRNVKYYSNGTIEWFGWSNYSYHDYVLPDIMNVTLLMERPEPPAGVFWALLNTTSRWINDSTVPGWTDSWYGWWIDPNITIGSKINYFKTNATVIAEERLLLFEETINCWVLNYTEPGYELLVFFDQKTGIFIEAIGEIGDQLLMNLTLVSTNVPIGLESLPVHNLDTGLNYATIQEAIDANETSDGNTILVDSGTYNGSIRVSKSLRILGESWTNTMILGAWLYPWYNAMHITASNVTVSNFTITDQGEYHRRPSDLIYISSNSVNNVITSCNITSSSHHDSAIYLKDTVNNTISGNIIGSFYGLAFENASRNHISNNVIVDRTNQITLRVNSSNNLFNGNKMENCELYVFNSSFNRFVRNIISHCQNGVTLWHSDFNIITGNEISHTRTPMYFYDSHNNQIHLNNVINNSESISVDASYNNVWDAGYPTGGNYWSNYSGSDLNNNGIGDTPYTVDINNTDHYPLIGMFSEFQATSGQSVQTICNSSITGFSYNSSTINFDATGEDGTSGFCRITIPTALMNETYKVFMDGKEIPHTKLPVSNNTHSYLYFTYDHSTKEVTIIPEFQLLIILPLFTLATLLVAVAYRRKKRKV